MHAPNNSKIISLTKIFQLEVGQKSGYEKCAKNDFFLGGGILFKTYQGIDHNNSKNVSFIKIAQLEVGQK